MTQDVIEKFLAAYKGLNHMEGTVQFYCRNCGGFMRTCQ